MAEKSNQVTRGFQRRINQLIKETLKDIRTEALEEFDRNFEREAFFNRKNASYFSSGKTESEGTTSRMLKSEIVRTSRLTCEPVFLHS